MPLFKKQYYYLIYVSQAVSPMSNDDHLKLIKQSYDYNQIHHITGILLYRVDLQIDAIPGRYMQLLEGQEVEVKKLFSKIKKDPRHNKITLINEGFSPKKHFKEWTMAFKIIDEQCIMHPGFINIEKVFSKRLSKSKFSVALNFLKTFYDFRIS